MTYRDIGGSVFWCECSKRSCPGCVVRGHSGLGLIKGDGVDPKGLLIQVWGCLTGGWLRSVVRGCSMVDGNSMSACPLSSHYTTSLQHTQVTMGSTCIHTLTITPLTTHHVSRILIFSSVATLCKKSSVLTHANFSCSPIFLGQSAGSV